MGSAITRGGVAFSLSLSLSLSLTVWAVQARAQQIDLPEIDPDAPPAIGQWAGPWDLGSSINPRGYQNWFEIAHALMLPNRDNAGSDKVLLICRRGLIPESPGCYVPISGFLWDPSDPSELLEVLGPATTSGCDLYGAAVDPFCGGHTFTEQGDAVIAGGTDTFKQVGSIFTWGHAALWAFVNDEANYRWKLLTPTVPLLMSRPRWYPTVTRLFDGDLLIDGNEDDSVYSPSAQETRERGRVSYLPGSPGEPDQIVWDAPPAGDTQTKNYERDGMCSSDVPLHYLGEYPRQHLLTNGDVFQTRMSVPGSLPGQSYHSFLNFLICSGGKPDRWTPLASGAVQPTGASRSSVHLLDYSGAALVEVVYDVGGGEAGASSAKVVKMVNPSETAAWEDDEAVAPDLELDRYDANCVIGLDGALYEIGGRSTGGGTRRQAERFKPPEIFESTGMEWRIMAAQQHDRWYHSTAVLLPDGRIVSAGGDDPDTGAHEPSWHSVELYSPPYLFFGPRPRITSFPGTITLGGGFSVSAILRTTSDEGEFRVALIAPGAATHSFDQSQMYARLKLGTVTLNSDPNQASVISAFAPPGDDIAPGWYMLTVVNSAGVPCVAKWVKLAKS